MPRAEEILTFIKLIGIVQVSDLVKQDIQRDVLARLVKESKLKRVGRGLYCVADYQPCMHAEFIPVALTIPKATISLLSALWYHGLLTQIPNEIWITLPSEMRTPKTDFLQLQVSRTSPDIIKVGREQQLIEDTPVYIYSLERTIVDCFKHRNRIGLDIATEALRNGIYQKKVNPRTIMRIARLLRMDKIIKPYLQVRKIQKNAESCEISLNSGL